MRTSIVLGTGGTTLYLPAELHVGAVKMSVFGYDTASDTTVRATTVPVTLNIRHSGFVGDDDTPIPPTPDLYQQLLKRIEDAEKGLDGKSAYEIAVAHGFVGTETEWLASLHGADGITPDMSEYPKTADVAAIVQQEIAPVAEEAHAHDNKATLDAITPVLFSDLDGLQQFEVQTKYNLQTIEEELLPLQQKAHTHHNKDILDGIIDAHINRWNDAYTNAINLNERISVHEGVFERFKTGIIYDMQGCKAAVTDHAARLTSLEQALAGLETALAEFVEVAT